MTNVIHTVHNSVDDSRHTWEVCLALKSEVHLGSHRDESRSRMLWDKALRNGRLCREEDKTGTQGSKRGRVDGRHWHWQRCWVFPSQSSKKVASSDTGHRHKKVNGGESRISSRKLIVIGQNPILSWENN